MITNSKGEIRLVSYGLKGLLYRSEDMASRLALANLQSQIFGRAAFRGQRALDQHAELQKQWRGRVEELRDQDWPEQPGVYEKLLNCPPAGVQTNWDHPNYCRKAFICPYCWCRRYAFEAHRRLADFYRLQHDQTDVRVSREPSPLLEVLRRVKFPKRCGARGVLAWMTENRRAIYDMVFRPYAQGCWQLFAPSPPVEKGRPWQLQQRMLIPLKACVEDIPVLDSNFQVALHTRITRKILVGAVGRSCSYPPSLILGPPNLARILCQRLEGSLEGEQTRSKRFCLSSVYGSLRRKSGVGGNHETDARFGGVTG